MNKDLDALEKIKELYKSYVEKIGLNEKDILGFDLSFAYIEKTLKAFKAIKTLFQGRCKLFERTENVETCNEAGCHAEKVATTSYILKFNNYDLHYEFYLHKEEYELLKEVGL